MTRFPYGLADFQYIRRQGMFYLDRTAAIRDLERLGETLVFLRPRRFGKSLWLQTLATYYDLLLADDFDAFFGGLDAGRDPTPERHRFFVLQWNFSEVRARGSVDEIAHELNSYLNGQTANLLPRYAAHLPSPVKIEDDAKGSLRNLLAQVSRTPYRLYLLIDEYDNFVNEVMVRDAATYKALLDVDGPFKELFKTVKSATEGKGLDRVFMTGVSPVALNDLTSGFNNARDVSHHPTLATLCGFREHEIRETLAEMSRERRLDFSPEESLGIMRTWYNGYRFSEDTDELVYNPTNALYFLQHLAELGKPPKELHDQNLRTDRGKLDFLARTSAGSGVIEQLTEGDGTVRIRKLELSFSIDDLLTQMGEDEQFVVSFLYYIGLLTRTRDVPPRLRIPNLVARKLLLDRLLKIFLPQHGEYRTAERVADTFFGDGELRPLLDFFEQKLLPVLSNRDRGAAPKRPELSGSGVNEMALKALFLAVLFDDQRYVAFSELELDRRYADLCLLVRSEMRQYAFFDVLFELKLVRRAELGKKGDELRVMDEAELLALTPVAAAVAAARDQVRRYRDSLVRKVSAAQPRCYVVVAVGLERLVGEEVS